MANLQLQAMNYGITHSYKNCLIEPVTVLFLCLFRNNTVPCQLSSAGKDMEQKFEELLETALYQKATDIHFTITDESVCVRLRGVNGLVPVETRGDEARLFNYLQYMANMDITCLNRPQSGAFSYYFQGQFYDFRFAVIQSTRQKNGVLRILNCHYGLTLEQLTDDSEIQKTFASWLKRRSGLILFTGLTGSGKTTTLYSLLKLAKGKTIYSIEDPIEVVQDNIIQLEVSEQTGFGYDEGIRQILRHNPDIIMIGEIRDEKTARMCIRASLTGTLVMSSLHARNSCSAVNRLLELGNVERSKGSSCSLYFW